MIKEIDITEIEGFRTGHAKDMDACTGCTVIISEKGAAAGCDIRGASPATRETDLLKPENFVEKINAVVLSGGSAFGLESCDGVMSFLREKGLGFETSHGIVPIVCGASLYDLEIGDVFSYPDKDMGYEACLDSYTDKILENGCQGAGTGATVGKFKGNAKMMKSGIGSYALDVDGLKVGAIVAVNAYGDVFDEDGTQIAGLLADDGDNPISTETEMINDVFSGKCYWNENTTIGCIITNADLSKAECTKISQIGHDGIARAIRPSHTSVDGDALFTMAGGSVEASFNAIGTLAAMVVQKSIINAVKSAESMFDVPSYGDIYNDR